MEYLRKMSFCSFAKRIMIASVQSPGTVLNGFLVPPQSCAGSFLLVLIIKEIVFQVGNNKSVHHFCQTSLVC